MTDSLLAITLNEPCATVAQPLLADLPEYVKACTEMDGEELGEYIERNWDPAVGNALGLMFLVKEMKRRFKLLDRKKQVNGEYKTIRGFASFDKWFTSFTGKSRRLAYYLLETEEKKNERNAGRRSGKKKETPADVADVTEEEEEEEEEDSTPTAAAVERTETPAAGFLARIAAAREKLADLHQQRDNPFEGVKDGEAVDINALYERTDPDPVLNELFEEFLALVSPKGYVVSMGDKGWRVVSEGSFTVVTPEEPKAKRSAAAKKAAATRAANKAAAQPAPANASPAATARWRPRLSASRNSTATATSTAPSAQTTIASTTAST